MNQNPISPEQACNRIIKIANGLHQYKIVTSIFIIVDADEWLDELETLLKKNDVSFKIFRSPDSDDFIIINPHNFKTIHKKDFYKKITT